jgi:hypothetical protein
MALLQKIRGGTSPHDGRWKNPNLWWWYWLDDSDDDDIPLLPV